MSSLVMIGKEETEIVREDITLGNITPAVGTERAYGDGTNPNNKYPGTTWQQDQTNFIYVDNVTAQAVTLTRWVRTV
jgi:hypothetical protein